MKYLKYLLICIPFAIMAEFLNWSELTKFILSSLSIIPLAGYLGQATEEIAARIGSKWGGFLNATFGNATELIICFFALKSGIFDVVKASVAGSVFGNILLVLGCSIFVGGLKYKELTFDAKLGNFTSTMLLFAVIGLSLPAVFTYSIPDVTVSNEYTKFSVIISIILLCIYILGMIYSFKTQKDLYGVEHAEDIDSKWPLWKSIAILSICTILIAIMSEILVGSIEPMTERYGISEMFVGLILIPIVGNAAEHCTAIVMALKNKMDIAIEISVGSSLQVALFVMPVLVILSLIFTPMSIVFKPIELFIFGASVLIATQMVSSGKTNWMEGLKLISIYAMTAVGFYFM